MQKRVLTKIIDIIKILTLFTLLLTATGCEPPVEPPPEETRVEKVNFSPAVKDYRHGQKIVLSTSTADTEIYYTIDGSDPITNGIRYSDSSSIVLARNETIDLKAYAKKGGLESSAISSATYTGTGKILIVNFHQTKLAGNKLIVNIETDPAGAVIRYTTDGTIPTRNYGNLLTYQNKTAFTPADYEGILLNDARSITAFAMLENWDDSDIATQLFTLQLDPPTYDPPAGEVKYGDSLTIKSSITNSSIYYKTADSLADIADLTGPAGNTSYITGETIPLVKPMAIKSIATMTDWDNSANSPAEYKIKLLPPEFNYVPNPDVTFSNPRIIELSTVVPNAVIYYTTDDSAAAGAFVPYNAVSKIPISETTTIRAFTKIDAAGWVDSEISSATYRYRLEKPEISIIGGPQISPIQVSITNAANFQGAKIRYTIDGNEPLPTSPEFNGSIWLNGSDGLHMASNEAATKGELILKVRAFHNDANTAPSEISTETYTFQLTAPSTNESNLLHYAEFNVKLTQSQGANISYTVDETSPLTGGKTFNTTTGLDITANTTLQAASTKDHWADSPVSTWKYILKTGALKIYDSSGIELTDPAIPYYSKQKLKFRSGAASDSTINIYYKLYDESASDLEADVIPSDLNASMIKTAQKVSQMANNSTISPDISKVIIAYAQKSGWEPTEPVIVRCRYKMPAPTLTPAGGIVTAQSDVLVSNSETNGVTIKFTKDGNDPATAPATSLPPNGTITISRNENITARAFRTGWASSDIVKEDYQVQLGMPTFTASGSPTTKPATATDPLIYLFLRQDNPTNADPITLTMETPQVADIIFSDDGTAPTIRTYLEAYNILTSNTRIKAFAKDSTGNFINSNTTEALFRFKVMKPSLNVGSYDYINDGFAVTRPTNGTIVEYSIKNDTTGQEIVARTGLVSDRVPVPTDTTITGRNFTVYLYGSRTDWEPSDTYSRSISRELPLPIIDMNHVNNNSGLPNLNNILTDSETGPNAGLGGGAKYEVNITPPITGAQIYYTTDGTDPDPNDSTSTTKTYDPANKPILLETSTVKAVAVKAGWFNSLIATETINICPAPTIDYYPASSSNQSGPKWTIKKPTIGTLYYKTSELANWIKLTNASVTLSQKPYLVKVVYPGYIAYLPTIP